MSKIGKKNIVIPKDSTVKVENMNVLVSGPKGSKQLSINDKIFSAKVNEKNEFEIKPINKTVDKNTKIMWGTFRSLINNAILGVSRGHEKTLDISGVGFRVSQKGENLVFQLGFSHDVNYKVPKDLKVAIEKQTTIKISGVDKELVSKVLETVNKLSSSFALGNALKSGVPVAIVGAPNTGKSTLLNQLLGEDRAIVSDEAGTTRDVIEETLNIDGILFRLIDTAGIRETNQNIEAMGIERSQQKIKEASIVLCLADASDETNLSETQRWSGELTKTHPDKKIILLSNKSDLLKNEVKEGISLSAKEGIGIDDLKSEMVKAVVGEMDLENDTIIANARHYEALIKTAEALEKANTGLHDGTTGDFIAMDIRQAMFHLGSITGDISTDDLLGNIFSKFCIGK